MKNYVYIDYSQSSDRYYTGYSHNPEESLSEHNLRASTSTGSADPGFWFIQRNLVIKLLPSSEFSMLQRMAEVESSSSTVFNLFKKEYISVRAKYRQVLNADRITLSQYEN